MPWFLSQGLLQNLQSDPLMFSVNLLLYIEWFELGNVITRLGVKFGTKEKFSCKIYVFIHAFNRELVLLQTLVGILKQLATVATQPCQGFDWNFTCFYQPDFENNCFFFGRWCWTCFFLSGAFFISLVFTCFLWRDEQHLCDCMYYS